MLLCFIRALDFNNARAMEQIGFIYDCGFGVDKDKYAALNWYKLAAEVGEIVEKNIDEAIKWFQKSAESGNKDAMLELAARACLADIYYSRLHNLQKAFELYKEVSGKGEDRFYGAGMVSKIR